MRDQVADQHIARAISRQGWLTLEEAAKAQGVSVRTIRRWMADGLPATTIGGKKYVHVANLTGMS